MRGAILTLALLAPCLPCLGSLNPPSDDEGAAEAPDCGVSSLLTLLKLEGHRAELESVISALPARRRDGYSLSELRDAASVFGLDLTGVQLRRRVESIDRTMLMFVRRGEHGHFIVVRPVGHTGRLLQLFDSFNERNLLDVSQLIDSSDWTGYALMPRVSRSVNRWPYFAFCAVCLVGCALSLRNFRSSIVTLYRRTFCRASSAH